VLEAQRQLPAPAAESEPIYPDEVAEVELEQLAHAVLAQLVDSRLELDLAGAIEQVQKGHPALATARRDPSGDPVADVGFLTRGEASVVLSNRADRLDPVELVRERIDAGVAERLELATAIGEDARVFLCGGRLAHVRSPPRGIQPRVLTP
jgi:hypothetical protein